MPLSQTKNEQNEGKNLLSPSKDKKKPKRKSAHVERRKSIKSSSKQLESAPTGGREKEKRQYGTATN